MDVSEVRHTDKRSQKEELRCVLAVIRHGGGAGGKGLSKHTTDRKRYNVVFFWFQLKVLFSVVHCEPFP